MQVNNEMNDNDKVKFDSLSHDNQIKAIECALAAARQKKRLLEVMQENCMSKKIPLKKILNEPKLLEDWLCEQYFNLAEVRQERPIFKHMMTEFRTMMCALGDAHTEVHRLLESKARRIARKHGFSIRKGKAPYSDDNQGLFQVLDREDVVCRGWNYDQSAQEVISFFRKLEKLKKQEKIAQFRSLLSAQGEQVH
jgi:hypothetical protein